MGNFVNLVVDIVIEFLVKLVFDLLLEILFKVLLLVRHGTIEEFGIGLRVVLLQD